MREFVDKTLSRDIFLFLNLIFLIFKSIVALQRFSFVTYVLIVYSILYFVYNRIVKNVDLFFSCYYISYGIVLVTIISILLNGYDSLYKTIIDFIPICINFLIIFPTFKYDDCNTLSSMFSKIMKCLFIIGIFISIGNIICYIYTLLINDAVNFELPRMEGLMGNPNYVGWFSIVFLGTILYINRDNNSFVNTKKVLVPFSFLVCIICIIFSRCRSVYFALMLYFTYHTVFAKKIIKFSKLSKLIITLLFIMLFCVIITIIRPDSVYERFDIYIYAIRNYLMHDKIFGLGLGKIDSTWMSDYFIINSSLSKNEVIPPYYFNSNTHNIIIKYLCMNGLIGALLLLIFFMKLFKKIFCYITDSSIKKSLLLDSCIYFVFIGFIVGMFDNCILLSITLYINFMFLISSSILLKLI